MHPDADWSEQTRANVQDLCRGFTVDVNVWSNEEKSKTPCLHFESCLNDCHLDDDDFLLLLNVEIKRQAFNHFSLTMHSGHHRGKAARIVRSRSILGRLFQKRMTASLSQVVGRSLSLNTSSQAGSRSPLDKRRTSSASSSHEAVSLGNMPVSVRRMMELQQALPEDTHLSVMFDNSIAALHSLRQNLLTLQEDDDGDQPPLYTLRTKEYAELIDLIIQFKLATKPPDVGLE